MKRIKNWLTPLVFDDEAKTQQAYLLHIILWTLIFVPIPYAVYALISNSRDMERVIAQVVFGETVNIILLIVLRHGYVKAASILQVTMFWIFFTATAATGNGVQGEAYLLGYALVISIAGMLLGWKGAVTFTILSLAAGAWMASEQINGNIDYGFSNSPVTTWVVSLVLFPLGALLQHLGGRVTRNALDRARASEERYRLISQVSSDYTFSTEAGRDGKLHLNWVAGAFEEITGYTFEEYVKAGGWLAHLHPDDVSQDTRALEKLQRNNRVVHEIRTYRRDGQLRWVRVYARPVWDTNQKQLHGIIGAVQDITVEKQAEDALRRSESIYRKAIEVAGAVPYHQTFNAEGKVIYDFMGEGIRQITGYGPEEFTDDLWGSMVLERHLLDELAPYSLGDAIQQVRSGNIPIWKCEHCIKAKDGKIRWVFEAAVDLRDEQGIAYGSVGLYQDITERKQSEELLKYERDLLQIFLNNIPDTVYFKDRDSKFVRINSAQARFLGLESPADAIGKTDLDFQPPEISKMFREEERRIVETGEEIINRIESNPTRDGSPRWLSATKVPVKDAGGDVIGIIGISRDITSQKLAEEFEQNRSALLEKVISLGQEVTKVQDLQTTLKKIWDGVRHNLDFDRTGIYLYEGSSNTMNGTFGTNFQGEMIEEWDSHISLDQETTESKAFLQTLSGTEGLYKTQSYETEHGIHDGHIMKGVKDFASVAARIGEKPVAVICVDNVISGRAITSEQLEALRLFAGYAGLSIENARLHSTLEAELEQQKKEEEREVLRRTMLEKVVRLGKSVTEVADTRTTMERIWHGVHDDLEFDRLAIFLYNTDDMSIDDTFGTNNRGEMVDEWHIRFPFSEAALFMRVLERPDGLYFTHNYDVENNIPEEDEMYGVKEYAAVAVWAGNKPVAVICVDHLITGRPISEEQLEALKLFAGYAGLAIENSHLNDALQIELQQQRQSEEKEARRRLMLEKVVSLGQQVTEVNDLTTTLKKIWHGVHDELLFDRLAIFLYDSVQSSVRGTLGTNNQGQIVEEWDFIRPVIQSESTSFKRALESPTGLFVTKDFAGEFNIPQGHEMYDVKDFASVAAWAGEKPVAIITVDNAISRLPFTEEQLEALRMFGGYAGLAIENARLNMVLQDELTQRQDLINELEAKNAELERFTYTVSHDLKSPLVTITGFLGFLEQDALSGNIERIKSGVNRISGAAQKMQALLNDLLELSRVGRLMNPPEDIPFTEIVNEAIDRVHGSINEIDAVVETQPEFPVIHGDRVRLVEVVQNLIDNALKYSNPETRTRVEIGTDGTNEKGSPVFFVRDNGIGIDPQYHERIFGLFNKLDNSSKGTGIGLSLVKRIIEVHNGRIWVESQLGQGSTFFFSLPTPPSKE